MYAYIRWQHTHNKIILVGFFATDGTKFCVLPKFSYCRSWRELAQRAHEYTEGYGGAILDHKCRLDSS